MSEAEIQLQVWHLRAGDLAEDELRRGLPWLSGEELEYFRACRSLRRKRQFARGRLLLRCALSHLEPEHSPGQWRFESGAHGKPALAADEPPIGFSLAHSEDHIVLITGPLQSLGIDLENGRKRRPVERLARRWFHPRELAELISLPAAARLPWFYRNWTIKEAWSKACGAALAPSLGRISVGGAHLGKGAGEFEVALDGGGKSCWRFLVLQTEPGFHCAIACQSDAGARLVSRRMTGLTGFGAMETRILAEARITAV